MRTRIDATKLVKLQLSLMSSDSKYNPPDGKGRRFHYGKLELRELLDFIYESKPKSRDEEI